MMALTSTSMFPRSPAPLLITATSRWGGSFPPTTAVKLTADAPSSRAVGPPVAATVNAAVTVSAAANSRRDHEASLIASGGNRSRGYRQREGLPAPWNASANRMPPRCTPPIQA